MTQEITKYLYPETAAEALIKWDSGEPIFTIEMGGLGPGYEQCIHIAAFEIIRALNGQDFPDDTEDLNRLFGEAIYSSQRCKELRLSGDQEGAAKQIAYKTMSEGWRTSMESVESDRRIQVSKHFP